MLKTQTSILSIFNRYVILFIMLAYGILFLLFKSPGDKYDRLIINDGKGYYAYLPALFIYQDLEYGFVEYYESTYYASDENPTYFKEFRFQYRGETVNKTFTGIAILMLPFFLIAHLLALLFGMADGYSMIYQYAIGFSVYFYLGLGLLLLKKLLGYFSATKSLISLVLVAISLGTNLVYYTVVEGTMPHVYLFFLVNLFLLQAYRAIHEKQTVFFLGAAVAFGLVLITRPQNGLIVLALPLLTGSFTRFSEAVVFLFKEKFLFLKTLVVLSGVIALQVVLWYAQTGYFLVYSYGDETFNFLNPQIINILWSFEKGWMIYTPLSFLALLGVVQMARTNIFRAVSFMFAFLAITYVVSSWWVWHYTSQFGQRVFIDFYGLLAIALLMGFSLSENRIYQFALKIIIGLLVVLNLFQFYQHVHWVYPAGPVTCQSYVNNFFRITPQTAVMIPGKIIKTTTVFNFPEKDSVAGNDISHDIKLTTQRLEPNSIAHLFTATYGNLGFGDETIIKTILDVWSCHDAGLSLRMDFYRRGEKVSDYISRIERNLQCDKLNQVEIAVFLPLVFDKNDSVRVSLFSPVALNIGTGAAKAMFVEVLPEANLGWIEQPLNSIQSIATLCCNMENCSEEFVLPQLGRMHENDSKISAMINQSQPFGAGFRQAVDSLFSGPNRAMRVRASVFTLTEIHDAVLVSTITAGERTLFYGEIAFESMIPGEWNQIELTTELPFYSDEDQEILTYFWDKSPVSTWFIDSLCIEFITLNDRQILPLKVRTDVQTAKLLSHLTDTVLLDKNAPFYGPSQISLSEVTGCEPFSLIIEAEVMSDSWFPEVSLVAAHYSDSSLVKYKAEYINSLTLKDRWKKLAFEIAVDSCLLEDDFLRLYFWNSARDEIFRVTNFNITASTTLKTGL
ncbi:MAG: hypothetical protein IH597_14335 [Bacteroidales bacterium]|nr:hypothetical protein [Bacteroidales bacterium]